MDEPIISVIIAVRDAERTIEESLESVLGQTFPDLEVIIVDDGSVDRTGEIVRQIAARDRRIELLHQEKRGLATSLNRAIAVARGRYVARQDGDDVSMPERLDRQLCRLEADTTLAALGTAAAVIDDAGRPIGRFPTAHGTAAVRDGLRTMRTTPVHGSMMLRRERLVAVGGYREAFTASQDFDLWLRLLEQSEIDNLEEPLYRWRVTTGSVYGRQRRLQLQCTGLARTFAHERRLRGVDSYPLLERCSGGLEGFAAQYALRGRLYAYWGELMLRGLNDPSAARMYLGRAIRAGYLRPRAVGLLAWSLLGLSWPGGRPLALPARPPAAGN